MKTLTIEQEAALTAFEAAVESHDLTAFGHGRKIAARLAVRRCGEEVMRLGVMDALTPSELAEYHSCVNATAHLV